MTAAIVLTFAGSAAMVALFMVALFQRRNLGDWLPAAAAIALLLGSLLQFADSMYEFALDPPRAARRPGQGWWRIFSWFVLVLGSIVALVAVWPAAN